jgi:hypothetical protein
MPRTPRPNVPTAPANESRAGRQYTASALPALRDGLDPRANRDVLTTLYNQICQSWRQHVDVRFKLLALVPSVSLVALGVLFGGVATPLVGLVSLPRLVLTLLGLALVAGLWIYDTRNSELHDDLVSRGRRIEEDLGIHTGAFRGRLLPRQGWITHGTATRLIYGATLAAWLLGFLYLLFAMVSAAGVVR